MPRGRPRKTSAMVMDDSATVVDVSEDFDDLAMLEDALSTLPAQGVMMYLYRMHQQGRPRFLTKMSPEDFDLAEIQSTYGGGKFQFKAYSGGNNLLRVGTFEIEGEMVIPSYEGNRASAGHWEKNPGEGGLSDILLRSRGYSDGMNRNGTDPLLIEIVKDALASKKGNDSEETERMLRQVALWKEVFVPQQNMPAETIGKAIEMGMEIGKTAVGGSSASDWTPLITAVGGAVEHIASAVMARRQVQQQADVPQNPEPEVTYFGDKAMLDKISMFLPNLMSCAAQDLPPEDWVGIICGQLPDDVLAKFKTWLESDQWFNDLCKLDKRIALQQQWWVDLRGAILENLNAEQSSEPEQK